MMVIISIIILLVVASIMFHIHKRSKRMAMEFIDKSFDLLLMYDAITEEIENEESDTFFDGEFYNLKLRKGDYKGFLIEILKNSRDVLDEYEKLPIEWIDAELLEIIYVTKEEIDQLIHEARIDMWKNGWIEEKE